MTTGTNSHDSHNGTRLVTSWLQLALIILLMAAGSNPSEATLELVDEVCTAQNVLPQLYSYRQSDNQYMGVGVCPMNPSNTTHLEIWPDEFGSGSPVHESTVDNATSFLVRRHSGGFAWGYTNVFDPAPSYHDYLVDWDSGQGNLPLSTDIEGAYGGYGGQCGLLRVWELEMIAGHEYSFQLNASVSGFTPGGIRVAILRGDGTGGWLSREEALREEEAAQDGVNDPFAFTAPVSDTYAVVIFTNIVYTSGGNYTLRVDESGSPQPELAIQSISPATYPSFSPIEVAITVANYGGAVAPASQARIAAGGSVWMVPTPLLLPGMTTLVTQDIGSYPAGSIEVMVEIDYYDDVDESDEDNNTDILNIIVTGGSMADLIVDRIDPDAATAGEDITITAYITNQGGSLAGTSTARVVVTGVGQTNVATPSLAPGATTAIQCNIGSFPLGEIEIKVEADNLGDVVESDNGNNELIEPITIIASYQPDLIVDSITFDTEYASNPVTASIRIRNIGNLASPATETLVRVNGAQIGGTIDTPALDPYTGVTLTCELGTWTAGNHSVQACADVSDDATESVETNNCLTETLALTNYLPDLVVAGIDPYITPPNVPYHDISIHITNVGLASASSSYTQFKLYGSIICDMIPTPSIAVGDTVTVHCQINTQPYGTNPLVYARANIGNAVEESITTNNTLTDNIHIYYDMPDLQIIDRGPDIAIADQDCEFWFKVKNVGHLTAPACIAGVRAGGEWVCDTIEVPALAVGDSVTLTCNIGSYPEGSELVIPSVDRFDEVEEYPFCCEDVGNSVHHTIQFIPQVTLTVLEDGSGDLPTIQEAVAAAIDHTIIELGDGTYTGSGNRDVSFGGKQVTIRSQSRDAAAVTIDCQASESDPHRGFLINSGEGPGAILEFLTVTNAYRGNGAAMIINSGASPTIRHSVFRNNHASTGGGGIYVGGGGSVMIDDCLFDTNTAGDTGGAITLLNENTVVSGCTFTSNGAQNGAAGIYVHNSAPTVSGCLFEGNNADYWGGAIFISGSEATPSVVGCTFFENSANNGGAIYSRYGAHPALERCLIAFNSGGGAVFNEVSSIPTFSCSDIYGNTGGDWTGDIADQASIDNNFSAEPQFCDAPGGDFRVSPASPCAPAQSGCGELVGALTTCTEISAVDEVPNGGDYALTALHGATPNPFNPQTMVNFTLNREQNIKLALYDMSGRLITILQSGVAERGMHSVSWNGRGTGGRSVASGVYFVRLRTESQVLVHKVMLLR